jgi:hydrogenase maturation factor
MCLSIPAQIVSINGSMAEVSAGGTIFMAGLQMLLKEMEDSMNETV